MAESPQELQRDFELYTNGQRVYCAILALIVFEYLITFDQEVACVWKRRFTATSLLLLSTRWIMILNQAFTIVQLTASTCYLWNAFGQVALFISFGQIALFSSLRVYALWHDSKFRHVFSALVLLLGCVPIGTNIFGWTRMQAQYEGPPFSTCAYAIDVSDELNDIMLYFTRCSAIASDLLVLVLTWVKTFAHWRQQRRAGVESSISMLLLRDGTVYFLVLLAFNVSQISTYKLDNLEVATNVANAFLQGLPPVLVQRFMLNLRQYSQRPIERSLEKALPSTIVFRAPSSVLGNIGEPLMFGEAESLFDAEEPSSLSDAVGDS